MKILVITDLYPVKEDEKCTPKTIKAFVDEWKNMGHEVRVIKPNFLLNSFIRKKPFYKGKIYGDVENINYFLPFLGKVKNKIKSVNFNEIPKQAQGDKKNFIPDIIFAHMPSGIIFANRLGLPFIAGVHVSDIEVLTSPLYRIYFKTELEKAYRNAKKIACRSFVLRDKFLALHPEFENKTFVAPSGINENYIVKRKWEEKDKIRVLTCGQFIKRKNIDKVIEACEKFNNVQLTIIGDGKIFKKLQRLSQKAIFTGHLPHEEVLAKMKESDIFILPSINETFGMVYLEAMASGCITICSRGDGIDGIIKDGENGFLTELDNIEETLCKAISFPQKDKILESSYETVKNYTSVITAKNYLETSLLS